mmetsp:Transcript_25114/g.21453  ORF Transcript_25114/g.21453 Transcript_25114/m.21453 type:complete len:100 (-) Transcript_25114:136-435(-)
MFRKLLPLRKTICYSTNLVQPEMLGRRILRLSTVPSELFTHTALVDLWLQGNNPDKLNKYTIKDIEGFDKYVDRRKRKIDKRIDSKAGSKLNLAMCGLE